MIQSDGPQPFPKKPTRPPLHPLRVHSTPDCCVIQIRIRATSCRRGTPSRRSLAPRFVSRARWTLALCALVAGGCVDGTGPDPVASIFLTVATGSVEVGKTLTVQAEARSADGEVLTGRRLSWSTSN